MGTHTNKPRAAIIIPAYNKPELLRRAVRSLIEQTVPVEIVVSDDGTERSALPVVEEFREAHPDAHITYTKTAGNTGPPAACNNGAAATEAEFISFLSHDDEYTPQAAEKMLAVLTKHNDVDVVVGSVHSVHTKDGVVIRDNYYVPGCQPGVPIESEQYIQDLLASRAKMEAYLLRHAAFDAVGALDTELFSSDAVDVAVRMCLDGGKGACVHDVITHKYTYLDKDHVGTADVKIRWRKIFLDKQAALFKKYPKIHAKHYYEMASLERVHGDVAGARRDFFKAWQLDKRNIGALVRALVLVFGMTPYTVARNIINTLYK